MLHRKELTLNFKAGRPIPFTESLSTGRLEVVEIERQQLSLGVVGSDCIIEPADEVEAHFDGVGGELVGGEFFVEMKRGFLDVERNVDVLLLAVVVIGHMILMIGSQSRTITFCRRRHHRVKLLKSEALLVNVVEYGPYSLSCLYVAYFRTN